MAEVPPPKRDAAAASEDEQTTKKQKTEGGTGLKRADGSPWEPITGTLVPIVGGKEGLKQEWTMIELQGDLVKKTESWDNQKLGDYRITKGEYEDGEQFTLSDYWRASKKPTRQLKRRWKGHTSFVERPIDRESGAPNSAARWLTPRSPGNLQG